jgi:HEXXH motif-containing protein
MSHHPEPWLLEVLRIPDDCSAKHGWLLKRIAGAPADVQNSVREEGLVLASFGEGQDSLFRRAEELIASVPRLTFLIKSLVEELHLLKADPGYDVSHSQPRWRSRVFVSIPDRSDDIGALRFAEGLVHEAMHLNLTLFEARHPIVNEQRGMMPSPWRVEPRPYSGVAHGLFVFACLRAYFDELRRHKLSTIHDHVQKRVTEIQSEVASIDLIELGAGLTPLGRSLAAKWHTVATDPIR